MKEQIDDLLPQLRTRLAELRGVVQPLQEALQRLHAATGSGVDEAAAQQQVQQLRTSLAELEALFDQISGSIAVLYQETVDEHQLNEAKEVVIRGRRLAWKFWQSWEAVNEGITDLLVRLALAGPSQGAASWESGWGPDGNIARSIATEASTIGGLDRRLLKLRYENGLTQRDIADLLDITQPSAASRLARAEASVTALVAHKRVRETLVAQGYEVEESGASPDRPARRFDFLAKKDEGRVGVEVLTTGLLLMPGRLLSVSRYAEISAMRGTSVVVAVYFQPEGEVGFYSPRKVLEIARRDPARTLRIDVLRDILPPAWAVEDALPKKGAGEGKGGEATGTE